jgi:hypothetical protein
MKFSKFFYIASILAAVGFSMFFVIRHELRLCPKRN